MINDAAGSGFAAKRIISIHSLQRGGKKRKSTVGVQAIVLRSNTIRRSHFVINREAKNSGKATLSFPFSLFSKHLPGESCRIPVPLRILISCVRFSHTFSPVIQCWWLWLYCKRLPVNFTTIWSLKFFKSRVQNCNLPLAEECWGF